MCLHAQRDNLTATAGLDGDIGSRPPKARKGRRSALLRGALLALVVCWHALIPLAGAAEEPY
ncbi:MAG: hypothetical protein WAV13_11660, partial [Thermodesulfovibrionales bacterium]